MEDPKARQGSHPARGRPADDARHAHDDPLLDGRVDNFLAAVAFNVTKSDGYRAALAWIDLSTARAPP
jgi:hypothetical protein